MDSSGGNRRATCAARTVGRGKCQTWFIESPNRTTGLKLPRQASCGRQRADKILHRRHLREWVSDWRPAPSCQRRRSVPRTMWGRDGAALLHRTGKPSALDGAEFARWPDSPPTADVVDRPHGPLFRPMKPARQPQIDVGPSAPSTGRRARSTPPTATIEMPKSSIETLDPSTHRPAGVCVVEGRRRHPVRNQNGGSWHRRSRNVLTMSRDVGRMGDNAQIQYYDHDNNSRMSLRLSVLETGRRLGLCAPPGRRVILDRTQCRAVPVAHRGTADTYTTDICATRATDDKDATGIRAAGTTVLEGRL